MTPEAIARIRRGQAEERDRQIAERVVARNLVPPEVVNLLRDPASPGSLAEALVRGKFVSSDQIAALLHEPAPEVPPEVREAMKDPAACAGKFVRVLLLGKGGMGEVWKAWDTALGRWVALKWLHNQNPTVVRRFRREAELAGRLTHPGIARIYEVGESWIAMQLIDGPTLANFPRGDRRRLVRLLRDAALAVHAAHETGVVHRDLKPQNLMVEGAHVFVLDFGLAREMQGDSSLTKSGGVFGTPNYMPPEQARGRAREVGVRSDVYSLGATLFDLLAGRPPFLADTEYDVLDRVIRTDAPDVRTLARGVDEDLATIVMKCLEKDPSRRYPTARGLAEDLTRYLNGEAILAHPPSASYRLRKFLGKRRAILAAAGIGLAVAAAVSAVFIPRWIAEARTRRKREAEIEARQRAQPHVDAGRAILAQLDRLLMTPDWRADDVRALAARARERLALAGNQPEALLEIARSYRFESHTAEAIAYATKAIEADRSFGPAYLERALLRIQECVTRGQDPGAADVERDLFDVKRWSTEPSMIALAEGLLHLAARRYDPAARLLLEYCAQEIADPRGSLFAGVALIHACRYDEAIAMLNAAAAYRATDANVLNYRGLAYLNRGKTRGAREDFEAAVRDYGEALRWTRHWFLYWRLGDARIRLGQDAQAERDLNEAVRLAPESAEAIYLRGQARHGQNKLDAAISDYDEAIRLDPNHDAACGDRGLARLAKGDPDGALRDYDRAVALRPEKAEHHFGRGNAHLARKEYDAAVADYTRALERKTDYVDAYVNRAEARCRTDLDAAIADVAEAIRLRPRYAGALFNRARYLATRGDRRSSRGDWEASLADCRAALDAGPDDGLRRSIESLRGQVEERLRR
ncbi:MAG: tetratricopeptide repeat protein [Planctomycetes bacterium]|nr:tetratricopeptide repeat protein [Planctomycetota bacterium]